MQETGIDLKRVSGGSQGGIQPAEFSVGMPRQTYRGLLRQIRAESRVHIFDFLDGWKRLFGTTAIQVPVLNSETYCDVN